MGLERTEQFRKLVEEVFSRETEHIEDQLDFDDKYQHRFATQYEKLIQIVDAAKTTAELDALMKAYLTLYGRFAKNRNAVRFHRSDQLFELLVEQSSRPLIGAPDLFAEYSSSIKTGQPSPSLRSRFTDLSPTYQSRIVALIEQHRNKRRAARSILSVLEDAYRKRDRTPQPTYFELYDFNPYPSETLRIHYERHLKGMQTAWTHCLNAFTPDAVSVLDHALDTFRKYIDDLASDRASKDGSLKLFQLLKYIRDVVRDTWRVTSAGDAIVDGTGRLGSFRELLHELYSMVCVELQVHALREKSLDKNRYGFTREEKRFLFNPIDGYQFASNIKERFNLGTVRNDELFEQSKHFLRLVLITRHHLAGMTLVNLQKILDIQSFWRPIHELKAKLQAIGPAEQARMLADSQNGQTLRRLEEIASISVGARQDERVAELQKGRIGVFGTPGFHERYGKLEIVYIDPRNYNDIYIEMEALKPQLFRVTDHYIQEKVYSSRILQVYESTIGMVYVTQFQMMAAVFLPVLIKSGFAGLIYEVGAFVVGMKVENEVAKLNPTAGTVLGLILQAVSPRPRFTRGVAMPSGGHHASVVVLDAPALQGARTLGELLDARAGEFALAADFNRSLAAKAKDKIVDQFMNLPSKERMAQLVDERLPRIAPEPAMVGVGDRGLVLRTGTSATSASGGARGTTTKTMGASRLEKSEVLRQVRDYQELLTKPDQLRCQQEIDRILLELARGRLAFSDASQELTNLLNAAKETTGEYIADGVVYSAFKVINEVAIPRRRNGVPMLDKVYLVENRSTRQREYVLLEVKGGERTRMGKVTAKRIGTDGKKMTVALDPTRMVKQGSAEWFYQKMVEIFQAGSRFEKLARGMFDYAQAGRVRTAIVKSGRKLDPYVTDTTETTVKFFESLETPFPKR
jgi:hypothetical protein